MYELLISWDAKELSKLVTEKLKEGYFPFGAPFVFIENGMPRYAQAVVKSEAGNV